MKAIVCTKYGPPEVLQLKEVPKPTPKSNEVLIRVFATTVTASDCITRGFKLSVWRPMGLMMGMALGFRKPRNPILGLVLAGAIETAGSAVRRFKVGDAVYAFTMLRFGAYAEYNCLPESAVMALKPHNLSYAEAAAIPYGGLLAHHFLKKADLQRGHKVLIYGASGAIGTAAVQLAKALGAEVTGVCSSTNLELVRALGADHVIDYTHEDAAQHLQAYDLILDAVGKRKSSAFKALCSQALTPNGKVISVDDGNPRLHRETLEQLTPFVESGQFKPVIDRSYPLEAMAEAHRYVDAGHKKGNVVITVA